MDPRIWTIIIMAVCTAILIGWDVYVVFFNRVKNDHDTISGILLGWSRSVWALPYAFGVLCGHFFLPSLCETGLSSVWSVIVLLIVGLLISGVGLWVVRHRKQGWPIQSPALLLVGIAMGHLFWPQ